MGLEYFIMHYATRVETLYMLTFEANFRHLDNYDVYPPYPPLISVVYIGDQIENLGEQHWKAEGGSKCQSTVSFVNHDVFFMKKSFFTDSVSTILQLVVA